MADLPISGLPSAGALSGTEPLAIVQSGATKQTTVQDVANLAGTTPPLADVLNQGNTSGPNDIIFDTSQGLQFNNSSKLREGTTDAGLGGNNGIAQVCSLDYELKWEAGRLYVMQQDGTTIRQSLYNFTTTPTATDDSTKGYAVGSLWTLDDGTTYECIDATATSADWIESSQSKFIEVTKAQLSALEGAGTLSVNVWYKVTDALANTAKILVSATSVSIVSKSAVNLTDGTFGQYTLSSDYYVPISGTVTSVNSGINISVDNTNPAAPIINSLADRYKTTSLSSILIGNGSKTFTVDVNLAYIPLQEVLIVFNASNHMHGTVTSYSGTTLVVDVKNHTGSGTYASWVINLDGVPVDAITGVGTVNRLAYFTAAQVIDDAAAITAARALKSDANGIPTHFDTATEPSLTELSYVKGVTSAIQTQINGKENTITAGTTSQYYRGDKTFQTLDKTAVGLSNVDNTSDANKPISTATQTALNAKQDTITGGATTITASNLTASRALISDASGKVAVSTVPSATLAFLDATSSIQTQLNAKVDTFTMITQIGTWSAPAASTTYYAPIMIGIGIPLTSVTTFLSAFSFATKIVGIYVQHLNSSGVQGSSQNVAIQIRNNTTPTSTQLINIQTNQASGVQKNFEDYTLNVSIAANDSIALQINTPAWTTLPTNAVIRITLFFQRT